MARGKATTRARGSDLWSPRQEDSACKAGAYRLAVSWYTWIDSGELFYVVGQKDSQVSNATGVFYAHLRPFCSNEDSFLGNRAMAYADPSTGYWYATCSWTTTSTALVFSAGAKNLGDLVHQSHEFLSCWFQAWTHVIFQDAEILSS